MFESWELNRYRCKENGKHVVIATTLKQACRVPSHSHFPLPFFSVSFSSRVVSCGPRGCDDGERSWLAWALPHSLWADCVSSERQIDVFPPCAHTLSQSCISIGTNTHACTRLASWQMYTHWLIAEREREREIEKCEDWHYMDATKATSSDGVFCRSTERNVELAAFLYSWWRIPARRDVLSY